MSCSELLERLDDYVDGELPAAEVHEVELHLLGCAACRDEERMLRGLIARAAALPRAVRPGRDLWPQIAAEIGSKRRWLRFEPGRSWAAAALAAAVLLLALVSLRHGSPLPPGLPSRPATGSFAAATPDPGLQGAEADYERATAALLAALREKREGLSPEMLQSLERNLAVIDRALAEVRQALGKDPRSPELNRMLAATHRKKVEVLQRMVKLSTSKL